MKNSKYGDWLRVIIAFLIIIIIIVISNNLVSKLKKDEEQKIKNYAHSLEILNQNIDIPNDIQLFLLDLIQQNKTIPVLLIDSDNNIIDKKNISDKILTNKKYKRKELFRMLRSYPPIIISLPNGQQQYIYYRNSKLLNELEYYPILLIFIVIIYIYFIFKYLGDIKKTEQSLLLVGMSKETAHQIGTPLSSIIGWLEILKLDKDIDIKPIENIEKDVERLKNIADRFSKIGSIPKLSIVDINQLTLQTVKYLQNRLSTKIHFEINIPSYPIKIELSENLYSWVIENIIKNSVDSMKNKGTLSLEISENAKEVMIDIKDEGQGISSKNLKRIFKPGFTTKTRGWGLGLSLAKRIISDYHHGKIFVLKTGIDHGSTFRIILRKYNS